MAPQDCIDYDQYKKLLSGQATTPRRNIFQQNRILTQQILSLEKGNEELKCKATHYQNLCNSLIEAISRVYSEQLAQELREIIRGGEEVQQMSRTFLQVMITHHSQQTVSEHSPIQAKQLRTPQKLQNSRTIQTHKDFRMEYSFQQSPHYKPFYRSPNENCSLLQKSQKTTDPSTNRSSNTSFLIATGINCEICSQTFSPNDFIQHATKCKEESIYSGEVCDTSRLSEVSSVAEDSDILREISLQDTQDRKLKKQSLSYMQMMENLFKIQSEIQSQIQILRFSKEKVDRDAEKRKLQKDLAKIIMMIQQKKKQGKQKQNFKKTVSKIPKSKKNSSIKFKN